MNEAIRERENQKREVNESIDFAWHKDQVNLEERKKYKMLKKIESTVLLEYILKVILLENKLGKI